MISKCGTLANDFMFSTQPAYGASGWSTYMFRNYSPRLGRWTQRDPAGQTDSLNLYQFCYSNPVSFVDPDGRFLFCLAVVVGIGVAALATTKFVESHYRAESRRITLDSMQEAAMRSAEAHANYIGKLRCEEIRDGALMDQWQAGSDFLDAVDAWQQPFSWYDVLKNFNNMPLPKSGIPDVAPVPDEIIWVKPSIRNRGYFRRRPGSTAPHPHDAGGGVWRYR